VKGPLCAAALLAILGPLGGACDAPDPRAKPVLLTSADFTAMLATQTSPDEGVAPGYGLPNGMLLRRIVEMKDGKPTLALRRTFSEGFPSAYVTTEIWGGFPAVWVQPAYVAVTSHDERGKYEPVAVNGAPWPTIFSVGPDSAFYGPYWEIFTFEVPPGEDVQTFRSARDVLDRGLGLRSAGGRVIALVPEELQPPAKTTSVGGPNRVEGWLGGETVHTLDFGPDTFTWNEYGVVEEAPIFAWAVRDANGDLQPLDIPTVAGEGPLYENRPAKVWGGNVPKYGSYWRLYLVEVPKSAGVFAEPDDKETRDALASAKYLYAGTYDPALVAGIGNEPYFGRVVANPKCLENADNADPHVPADDPSFPNCRYLDSQRKIEALIPDDKIHKTDLLVTCPFVSYWGTPVPVAP
jgi:hypothetical protein